MRPYRNFLVFILMLLCVKAYSQQDVEFHLSDHLLPGKTIIKVKRDFHDPYLWVLAKNNEVYRVNSITKAVDNYTPQFAAYNNFHFIDIAGRGKDSVFVATDLPDVIQLAGGVFKLIDESIIGTGNTVTSIGVDCTGRVVPETSGPVGNVLLIGTVNGVYRYNMDSGTALLGSDKVYSQIFEATYRRDLFLPLYRIRSLPTNKII